MPYSRDETRMQFSQKKAKQDNKGQKCKKYTTK